MVLDYDHDIYDYDKRDGGYWTMVKMSAIIVSIGYINVIQQQQMAEMYYTNDDMVMWNRAVQNKQ